MFLPSLPLSNTSRITNSPNRIQFVQSSLCGTGLLNKENKAITLFMTKESLFKARDHILLFLISFSIKKAFPCQEIIRYKEG